MEELEPDEIDLKLIAARRLKRDRRTGVRAGDYVRMLDGTLRRFSSASPSTSISNRKTPKERRRRV
jgi:hypothetical protein